MSLPVKGIHHITAIAGDPQRNLDFYAGILGMRFLKKTVNFDDPGTYHFYYGDGTGTPGSILTFFPWPGNPPRGTAGTGQAVGIAFSVAPSALWFWQDRLLAFGIAVTGPHDRAGNQAIAFEDPDGMKLELVAAADDRRSGWQSEAIPADYAIKGFYAVTLALESVEQTASLMEGTMGMQKRVLSESHYRFEIEGAESGSGAGGVVDILCRPDTVRGRMGAGSIHHVAFRVTSDEAQLQFRQQLLAAHVNPTPVIDRQYFRSVYFREPGGVLFEVATDPPGFTVDESDQELGTALKLPPQYESERERIEAILPRVRVPAPAAPQRSV